MSRRSNLLPENINADQARVAVFQTAAIPPRDGGLSRVLNILGAFVLMICLAPLVLAVALVLRLRQGPGVLTRENRLGLHSVVFRQWTFRIDQPDGAGPVVSDTSGLQNLPALLNVIAGDMVIFGPRPVCPIVARAEAARDPVYTERFAVKPGLLG